MAARLEFQDDLFVYEKIQNISANYRSVANQRYVNLFLKLNSTLAQINRHGLLVILFSLSSSDLVMSIKTSSNNLIAQLRQHQFPQPTNPIIRNNPLHMCNK